MTAIELRDKLISVIITPLLQLFFAVALVVFAWGVVQFLLALNKGGKLEDGKQHMLWGILGMAIMMGAYGIITIVLGTFNVNLPTQ